MFRRAALVFAFLLSCSSSSSAPSGSSPGDTPGGGSGTDANPNSAQLFSKQIAHVFVEVAYVPGAEPYVGAQYDFGDIWTLFKTNADAVFDGKKNVVVATALSGMEKLGDVAAGDMSKQNLVDLASTHRKYQTDLGSQTQAYWLVFVNGHFVGDDGTPQPDVTGVSVGDTGIVAVFKPAYASYFNAKSPVAQIIEQISVIHQFGHAVGWVNHGVPIAQANQPHEDTAHAGHCTNAHCAMAFSFESAKGIASFVGSLPVSATSVLYDQECLSDVRILESSQL